MRPEEFGELLNAQPFVPLRVYLTDGKTYDIPHSEFVWVFRSRVDLAIPADPAKRIMDHVEHFSLLHVVRVERLQPTSVP